MSKPEKKVDTAFIKKNELSLTRSERLARLRHYITSSNGMFYMANMRAAVADAKAALEEIDWLEKELLDLKHRVLSGEQVRG